MPIVLRTVSALPISQVSFPFSSSIMNRRPVPDVSASAFWVTPSFLRVSRISLPMSAVVYFKGSALARKLPYGNIIAGSSCKGD